jgi:4-amino-4-deoxy-L-arabinose transferase-like glycosyltransferase
MRCGVLTVLAVVVFLPRLGDRQIVTSHEARVAQTARQMAASGWPWNATSVSLPPSKLVVEAGGIKRLEPQWTQPPIRVNPWLIPVLSGQIRLQKPPLPYWCAAVLYRVAGVPWSERLTRLIPALLGALGTFMIYELVRLTMGRTKAWCAAIIWVSSYFIAEQFRLAMADSYLALATLACMWMWVRASQARHQLIPLKLFYFFLALGMLAKGPAILVPVVGGIVLYHVFLKRNMPRSVAGHLVGGIAFFVVAAPWYLYIWRHVPNAWDILRYESLGELPGADNIEKARAFWFYLPQLFVMTLPWTPIWIAGIVICWMRRRRQAPLFPLCWYAVTVLFFSILPVKKDTYLLPIMPAQVMITAVGLATLIGAVRRLPHKALLAWVQAGIGLAGGITAVVLAVKIHQQIALAVAALSLASACGAVAELRAHQGRLWMWRQVIAYTLSIVVIFDFYNAQRDNQRSAKHVCQELVALMQQTGQTLAPGHVPEEAALYLPLDLPLKRDATSMLAIVDDPKNQKQPLPAGFVDRVPWRKIVAVQRVPMSSAPDNARWKVYRLQLDQ